MFKDGFKKSVFEIPFHLCLFARALSVSRSHTVTLTKEVVDRASKVANLSSPLMSLIVGIVNVVATVIVTGVQYYHVLIFKVSLLLLSLLLVFGVTRKGLLLRIETLA